MVVLQQVIWPKKEASLCSDNVAWGRGWHSREIKLEESKCEEGHIALGVK
jgi:hypothetical protein